MTEFDYALMAVMLLSLVLGLWRGFIYEVLSLLGWPIAFVLSNIYANSIVHLIPLANDSLRLSVVYVLLFAVVLIAWGVLVMMLTKLLKAMGSGWPDRMLGGLFGIVRGGFVVLIMMWMAGMTALPDQQFWRNAQTSRIAEDVALLTKAWLPDNIAQNVRYRIRS